jgi:pimeloyl-ACP methyl ester carboxylesterase
MRFVRKIDHPLLIVLTSFLALVFIVLSGCTNRIKLSDCNIYGVSARCGFLDVYENRSSQGGRKITLNIVVLPATGSQPKPDPLFYFAGGPGGAITTIAPVFKTQLSELNKDRDIVLLDQRGVGGSNPLFCQKPENDIGLSEGEKLGTYYQSCLDELDADLGWYSTKAYVDDVDEVRQALGYEKINIAGESYGGTVVQVYLLEHPESVRTASVLRSSYLKYPVLEHFADNSQRVLDAIFSRCKADRQCGEAFPSLDEDFNAIMDRLAKEPVTTTVWDPENIEPIIITKNLFVTVIHYLLMGSDTAVQIPQIIHRTATKDDWELVAKFHLEVVNPLLASVTRQAMPINILCNEPWASYRSEEVAKNGKESYFGQVQFTQAESFAHFCPLLPKPDPDALYGSPQITDIPVLILAGEEDPQNGPLNVADMKNIYINSRIIIEPYRAHLIADWSCTGSILKEFIVAGSVSDIKAGCIDEIEPYPFNIQP